MYKVVQYIYFGGCEIKATFQNKKDAGAYLKKLDSQGHDFYSSFSIEKLVNTI